jgi:hypothetical protein
MNAHKARLNGFKLPWSFVTCEMKRIYKRAYDIIRIRVNEKDFKFSERNLVRKPPFLCHVMGIPQQSSIFNRVYKELLNG